MESKLTSKHDRTKDDSILQTLLAIVPALELMRPPKRFSIGICIS